MVPPAYVELDALPLTPNGKVDRRALPDFNLAAANRSEPFVVPASEMEVALASIWTEVLGVERVSVDDNFFDLGGHSLLCMQVIARLEEAVGVGLSARDVVLQSLRQLAAMCDGKGGGTAR